MPTYLSRMKYCHGKCRLDFDLAYALSSHCDDTQHLVNLVALPVVFSLMFPISDNRLATRRKTGLSDQKSLHWRLRSLSLFLCLSPWSPRLMISRLLS
jgi:hypothetical protein